MSNMKRVDYEWTVETLDRDSGDILESEFFKTYREALRCKDMPLENPGQYREIGLVRDAFDVDGGLMERTWAYVHDNMLPIAFSDAYDILRMTVPQRFHNEVAANLI